MARYGDGQKLTLARPQMFSHPKLGREAAEAAKPRTVIDRTRTPRGQKFRPNFKTNSQHLRSRLPLAILLPLQIPAITHRRENHIRPHILHSVN